ncbi:MAG TPA: pectinesterase family protein [Bacteroidales bacterium]
MKQTLLLMVLIVGLGLFNVTKAQTTASATWVLSDPASSGTDASVATSGQVSAVSETISNLVISYKILSGTGESTTLRRYKLASNIQGGSWDVSNTDEISGVYIQYAVTPKSGNILYVDSFKMDMWGQGTGSVKANVYYSTDETFATKTKVIDAGLTAGFPYQYISTPFKLKVPSLSVQVNQGQTFYIRVYPYVPLTSNSKYLSLRNVVISGHTEALPVPSSIVWPCSTDLSSVVTGNMVAGTPILSSLLNYGKLAYGGVNGVSIYTGAVWQAETAPAEGRYIQFSASPKTGGTLVVDSVTLKMAAYSTNDLRVSIYYSKDPGFTLATGIQLVPDVAITNAAFLKTKGTVGLTVNSGESVYFRLYPYSVATSGDKWKLVGLNDVSIYGSVTGVTADPPTVATTAMSNISTTYAASGGTVSSDGGAAVTERGVVWNTSGAPTIADNILANGTGSGSFVCILKGLTANTTYYVRAYATNSAGTSYGSQVSFTSLDAIYPPTVTTTAVSSIMVKTATSGGNVTAWGGDTITTRGICWSTVNPPTISDNTAANGSGLGSYTAGLVGLTQTTTYYVRAYATSKLGGTGYGNVVTFTTQAPAPDVTKTVAKDGSGDYTTIQAAFRDVPTNYTGKWTIFVKPGVYYEKDTLATGKVNVILRSIHPDSTIITYNAYADSPKPGGGTMGTSGCASVAIDADDFTAINITFQNTKNSNGTGQLQAVALRSNGDRQSFYNCKIMGYQDTYYAWGGSYVGRIYMKNCYLEGSVDYIFGRDVVVLDSCQIHTNRDGGTVTAASTDAASKFGLVFRNCKLTSLKAGEIGFDSKPMVSFYLGRPWQSAPQTVYITCEEPATLNKAGWLEWNVSPALYAEYKCFGPGSGTNQRSSSLSRQLTDVEAINYKLSNIFSKATNSSFGFDWLPDTTLIYKFKQTLTIADIPAKTYGDKFVPTASATSKLPVTFTSSNLNVATSGDTVTVVGLGSSVITARQPGNYLYSAAPDSIRTLTVATKATITAVADNKTKTYGDANPAFTISYSGFVNGENSSVVTTVPSVTTTATSVSPVGDYDLTVGTDGVAANYNIVPATAQGKMTIGKATLNATADNKTKTYGDAIPAFTVSYSGFVNGENSSVVTTAPSVTTTATAASPAGDYDLTVGTDGVAANYTIVPATTLGKLTINKASLTAKADDVTKKHGEANPTFTITYTGFVNGDTKASITEPTASSTADANSGVGTYPITLLGGSAANYNITLVNGTLTVTSGTPVNTAKADEVMIYPNPSAGTVYVKRANSLPETLVIMDMSGAKLVEKKLTQDVEPVDVSSLPKGTYILKLQDAVYKLAVQ